ncbi:MAG: FtsX-like permease family protein [Chloroflexi bacterium]|nr:MAG: FtsX-like permease family protein [Chloroflexota bacterium]
MRIRPRWKKVWRDLWLNKSRTLVVVLSIAVGVFAIGMIMTSYTILSGDLRTAYLATNPAHATIFTFDSFGEELVTAIERMPEVKEAEARRRVLLRAVTGPEDTRLLWAVALPDYDDIKIDKIRPLEGDWPPPEHEILVERSALGLLKAQVGDVLPVKLPDGKIRQMRIAGLVHDLNAAMFVFDGVSYGFIHTDTLEWLDQSRDFNELRFVVEGENPSRDYIQQVANKVRDKVERGGHSVYFTFVPEPGKHLFLDPILVSISVIMGAMGAMALVLSGFLVVNTVAALLAQQTRQIGMMKAVGARTRQVMELYLATVVLYGLLALLIAVPLGAVTAFYFSRFIAGLLNFDVTSYRLPPNVLATEILVGVLVPVVAALGPIFAGTRVTVREAISAYGLGKGRFGTSMIDRFLLVIQHSAALRRRLSRPLLLSLRNTFRRKLRLTLTLLTLVLGGAIFITVFSVRASMMGTLRSWLDYFQYDVAVQFERDYRVERILQETMKIPGIDTAEVWGFYNTRRERPDGSHSDNIMLFAPPPNTKLVKPTIIKGRWLLPEDEAAVVVNSIVLRDEPDLDVGQQIVLKIEGKERPFTIVGVATGGMPMGTIFANYPYFARVSHNVGRGQYVFATTKIHTLAFQSEIVRALEEHFEYIGMDVAATAKVEEEMGEVEALFQVVIVLLLLMAVLLAVIGGLGLMGTMSINVLERTREIGVMRAIGASNRAVRRVFIVEGIIIGVLSWLAGAVLAFPLSYYLSDVIGKQFLNAPLDHTFSLPGVVIWLAVVIVLSAVASFLPAWNASRLTVREVLAYE